MINFQEWNKENFFTNNENIQALLNNLSKKTPVQLILKENKKQITTEVQIFMTTFFSFYPIFARFLNSLTSNLLCQPLESSIVPICVFRSTHLQKN